MSPLVAARAAATARGYGWGLSAGGPSGGFEAIATVTAAGGETSLTFTSIPQNYVALQIRGIMRSTSANSGNAEGTFRMRFNGVSTATYDRHRLRGNGSSASAGSDMNGTEWSLEGSSMGGGSLSSTLSATIFDIHDYSSTTRNKTLRWVFGGDQNGSAETLVGMQSGLWRNTAAVTSINLIMVADSFAAGTTFALYGIKGAA